MLMMLSRETIEIGIVVLYNVVQYIPGSHPVAPVVQLVTSKPSDMLGREFESR